jgi:hypothetical protein
MAVFTILRYMRKDTYMLSDRRRILELALETLENKKKQLDLEIAEITRELRGETARKVRATGGGSKPKRAQFSKQERLRRSQRMKEYWDNWHKKRSKKP